MQRPDWSACTAAIVATGPSLTDAQCALLAERRPGLRVVTVNRAFQQIPWADVYYFGDYLFAKVYAQQMLLAQREAEEPSWFRPSIWTIDRAAAERWRFNHVRAVQRPGLGRDCIHANGTSGLQAINLATLFGARRILLVGFDMRPGPGGQRHYFGDYPAPCTQAQLFDEWLHKAEAVARSATEFGIVVTNCTPGSAMTCFPMGNLEEHLP